MQKTAGGRRGHGGRPEGDCGKQYYFNPESDGAKDALPKEEETL